jgi:DNA-binding winged helix-turn-helix (wHTH) protein
MHGLNPLSDTHSVLSFDSILVDANAHIVQRNHVACDIEPKAFSVLVYLMSHAGKVVTKDELLDAVWNHRCVTPNVLSRVITQLRHALGDTARHSKYIETVPTLGYRFIAKLQNTQQQKATTVSEHLIFQNDMVHSSELLEELNKLLSRLDGQQNAFPALTRHLTGLVTLFGDKPSGMVLYELALEYGLERIKSLDLDLPWRLNGRRESDSHDQDEN